MGRAKVTSKNIDSVVQRIMQNYAQEVADNLDKVAEKVAKSGRTALKNESKQFDGKGHWGKGNYSSGWRVTKVKNLWYRSFVIHNSKRPTETHLLEYGHELTPGVRIPAPNGSQGKMLNTKSRSKAFPHIDPVGKKVVEEFERGVEIALRTSQ